MSFPTRVLSPDKGGEDVNTSGSGKSGDARKGLLKPEPLLDAVPAGVPTTFETVDQRPGQAPVPGRLSHLPAVASSSMMDGSPARPVSDTASPGRPDSTISGSGAGGVICRRCRERLIGSEVEYGLCGDCGDRWRRGSLRNGAAA